MKRLLAILLLCGIAVAQAQSGPTLTWSANPVADSVLSYNVYEHVGTVYNLLGTVIVPAPLSFSLAALPITTTHLLAVTAVNVRGESSKSADILLPTAPTVPTGLKIGP